MAYLHLYVKITLNLYYLMCISITYLPYNNIHDLNVSVLYVPLGI